MRYGALASKLENLGLPGVENVQELNKDLAEILETDASDVPQRMGSTDSTLYSSLKWAAEVTLALKNGLENTIRELREHWKEIQTLPDTGTPGKLRSDVEEALQPIAERLEQDNFYAHTADLNAALTQIKTLVRSAAQQMMEEQKESIRAAQQELQRLYEWTELTHEEQSKTLAQLEALAVMVNEDLNGLKKNLSQEYTIQYQVGVLKQEIIELGHQRQLEHRKVIKDGEKFLHTLHIPLRMTSTEQLEKLIQQLQKLKSELGLYKDIEVTIELKD